MKKFLLFAARDGEAIVRTTFCPDLKAAEDWAFEIVQTHYEIDLQFLEDFVDIESEIDGMILMDFDKLQTIE